MFLNDEFDRQEAAEAARIDAEMRFGEGEGKRRLHFDVASSVINGVARAHADIRGMHPSTHLNLRSIQAEIGMDRFNLKNELSRLQHGGPEA